MTEVCYEVRLTLDPAIQAKFDPWLAAHVDAMLTLPGIQRARLVTPEPGADGRPRRIVRYQLESRQALDTYFRDHAAKMRADGQKRFGGRFQAQRDVYPVGATRTVPPEARCPNCGQAGPGEYCPQCGQEQKSYHIAFHRLVLDYLGDAFMFDSRVFRSLKLLLLQPGRLTRENLEGRRARYIPALRLYLFTALIFFSLSSAVDWRTDNSAEGFARGTAAIQADMATDKDASSWERAMARMGIKAMQNPDLFMANWISNISLSMLVFLPLYALFLKLLYMRSGFYYLEHLIFALHAHAFVFIAFTVALAYTQYLTPLAPQLLNDVLAGSLSIYILFYTLPALKHVYRQGWWMTVGKFLILGVVYLITIIFGIVSVMFVSLYSL